MDNTIYLVRHTKPLIDEGICYGYSDISVSHSFEAEYSQIVSKLKGVNFSKVYSSPLQRCHKLASTLSNNVVVDDRLKELNFGEWELKSWDYIYSLEEGKNWFNSYLSTTCPSGESFIDLKNRVDSFISSTSLEKDSLIVTHAGVIKAFLSTLNIISPEDKLKLSFGEVIKIKNGEFKTL